MLTYIAKANAASTASKHSLTYHLRNNQPLLKSLGLTCVRTWDLLHSMDARQAAKSRNDERYSYPSQQWIADELRVCRKTINETCAKLKAAGLLYIKHRCPKLRGQISNLYATGLTMWECLRNFSGSGRKAPDRCNPEVTRTLKSERTLTLEDAQGVPEALNPKIKEVFMSLKRTWEAHRRQPDPS
jgi:hypothetical protein